MKVNLPSKFNLIFRRPKKAMSHDINTNDTTALHNVLYILVHSSAISFLWILFIYLPVHHAVDLAAK